MHVLEYRKVTVDVPTPQAVIKGVRVHKAKIQLSVPCMTNTKAIAKGSRLVIGDRVPADLAAVCPLVDIDEE